MVKTSVGVWSRSIADWNTVRNDGASCNLFLVTDTGILGRGRLHREQQERHEVGGCSWSSHNIPYPSNSASWRCGFFLVSASDGLPRATFFVVQQHFPAQCPAKIFRTRNMERDCKIQVKCFHHQYLMFSLRTIQGQNWGSKWAPEQGGARGRNGDRICQIASKELRASNIPNEEFPLGLQVRNTYW